LIGGARAHLLTQLLHGQAPLGFGFLHLHWEVGMQAWNMLKPWLFGTCSLHPSQRYKENMGFAARIAAWQGANGPTNLR
jgi:hypothetical protein